MDCEHMGFQEMSWIFRMLFEISDYLLKFARQPLLESALKQTLKLVAVSILYVPDHFHGCFALSSAPNPCFRISLNYPIAIRVQLFPQLFHQTLQGLEHSIMRFNVAIDCIKRARTLLKIEKRRDWVFNELSNRDLRKRITEKTDEFSRGQREVCEWLRMFGAGLRGQGASDKLSKAFFGHGE